MLALHESQLELDWLAASKGQMQNPLLCVGDQERAGMNLSGTFLQVQGAQVTILVDEQQPEGSAEVPAVEEQGIPVQEGDDLKS